MNAQWQLVYNQTMLKNVSDTLVARVLAKMQSEFKTIKTEDERDAWFKKWFVEPINLTEI